MRVKYLFLNTLFSLLISSPAIAADWVYVDSTKGAIGYVDKQSIKGDMSSKEFWQRMVYKERQREPVAGKYYVESKSYVEIDCNNDTFIIRDAIYYSSDGEQVGYFSPPHHIERITPDSLEEEVRKYVCSDWVHLATYADFELYVDKQSLKRNAPIISFWIKSVYNKKQRVSDTDKYYIMRREYWEMDCKNNLATVHEIRCYSDDNKLVIGWRSPEVNVKIIPGTLGNLVEKYVCNP